MPKRLKIEADILENDKFLTKNFEKIVDEFAGGFVIICNGKILYTDRDGTPAELTKRIKKEYPGTVPLFFRVPYPHEFICALLINR